MKVFLICKTFILNLYILTEALYWKDTVSATVLAGVLSLFISIAGLPGVKE